MIIEVMVTGDEKVENFDFFQKVAGVILDFMGTIEGHGNGFFQSRKNAKKKNGFSKCRSDHFRGPNRRILGQGIGQNLNRTIFEKVEKTVIFSTCWKNLKKSSFFDGFLYSKLPMNRPWRPITGIPHAWFTSSFYRSVWQYQFSYCIFSFMF